MTILLLAICSGLLFAISLPPYNVEWLAWFALAPLLISVQRRRPLEAVGLAIVAGASCGIWHTRFSSDAEHLLWGVVPFLWVTVLLALVASVSARWRGRPGWPLLVAALGVTGEWLTTFLQLPVNVALTQYKNLELIQMASVTGIWGVSFLLWLVNACIADAILSRRWRSPQLFGAAGTVVLVTYVGYIVLGNVRREIGGRGIRAAAIQDFSAAEVGSLTNSQFEDADRDKMTVLAAAQGAKLIVTSEESLGTSFNPSRPDDPMFKQAKATHAVLVIGYSEPARPKPFNCAGIVETNGTLVGVHHKIHLYPSESQTIQAGSDAGSFATSLGRIGLEVCFDSCFTAVTRSVKQSGAALIAMPNYDPPSPRGILHYLHGAVLPFRAVENRISFVRADSNGLSQIVNPDGAIVQQGPLYSPAIVAGSVYAERMAPTFFTRWGDWVVYACLTVTLLQFVRRRKTAPSVSITG